jgi:hypothetical protein
MTDEQLAATLQAVFLSLGQAMGPKVLVNASVLLAQLAQDKSVDSQVRAMLQQIGAVVDRA